MTFILFRFANARLGPQTYAAIEEDVTEEDLKTLSDAIVGYIDAMGYDERPNRYTILCDIVGTTLDHMTKGGIPIRWHFVKYADGETIRKTFDI
jgi:hypothetical protein